MKRLLLSIFAIVLLSSTANAQWKKGFNFRNTSAYCTDLGDDTWIRMIDGAASGDAYPTTRNTVTFGDTGVHNTDNRRDRNSGLNCKLAGVSFYTNNTTLQKTLRIDLPSAGNYKIRVALGEPFTTVARPQVQVYDDTTLVATVGTTATLGAEHYLDAVGTDHATAAAWVSSNAQSAELTFATTTLFLKIGRGDSSAGSSTIAHFEVEQMSTPTPTPTPTASARKGQRCTLAVKGQCGYDF